MFTGIIGGVGRLVRSDIRGGDRRLLIEAKGLPLGEMELGESVAVNARARADNGAHGLGWLGRRHDPRGTVLRRAVHGQDRRRAGPLRLLRGRPLHASAA